MSKIELESIGTIHTPFKEIEGMPIQAVGAKGVKGELHIKDKFKEGLKDLDGFSHINILFEFHKVEGYELVVKPFLDNKKRGIFATRSPKRPNHIGSSIVEINEIEDNIVHVSNVDILDGTPLIDIKPYVPHLWQETIEELKIGWFEDKHQNARTKKSDARFK